MQPTSPCIDAATSDTAPLMDMVGAPRFDAPCIPNTGGGTHPYYDMGALEYRIEGDFDGDGDEDGSDLAVLASDLGRLDLATFAADLGRIDCPAPPP